MAAWCREMVDICRELRVLSERVKDDREVRERCGMEGCTERVSDT